jgi:hypothetical protein
MNVSDAHQVDWMESMVNLEVRNFTVKIARHFSLTNEDIETYLEPIKLEVGKRQRRPATEKRCVARLIKGGKWTQCSHKYSQGNLCKTHAKMSVLKYGTVLGEIPEQHKDKASFQTESTEESNCENDFRSPLTDNYNDISLYPQSNSQLTEINIAGVQYLQDEVTSCLYTYDRKSPKFIGRGIGEYIVHD